MRGRVITVGIGHGQVEATVGRGGGVGWVLHPWSRGAP